MYDSPTNLGEDIRSVEKTVDGWRKLDARQGGSDAGSNLTKQQRTRRRLLGFAIQLFAEQGYHPTTVAQIAQAAGVSRATFFLHFPTKAALLGELSRELASLWSDEKAPRDERAIGEIRRFLVFLFREADIDTTGTAALGADLLADFVQTYGTDMSAGSGPDTLHHLVTRMIERAQAEGDWTRRWSAETLAHTLLGTYNTVKADLAGAAPEDAADALFDLLALGMAGESAGKPSPVP